MTRTLWIKINGIDRQRKDRPRCRFWPIRKRKRDHQVFGDDNQVVNVIDIPLIPLQPVCFKEGGLGWGAQRHVNEVSCFALQEHAIKRSWEGRNIIHLPFWRKREVIYVLQPTGNSMMRSNDMLNTTYMPDGSLDVGG